MISEDHIRTNFDYLDSLPFEGWMWEFIRRNEEFLKLNEKIQKDFSQIELSLSDDNVIDKNKLRIKMPPGFSNTLTCLENHFGLRPNLQNEGDLDPDFFTIIRIEQSEIQMGIPNPSRKYTEFGQIKPFIIGILPISSHIIDHAMINEWKNGDLDKFQKYCVKMITKILPPTDIENTLYIGINLNAKKEDILYLFEDILDTNKPRVTSRRDKNVWKDYLMVYDLHNLKRKGIEKRLTYDMIEELLTSTHGYNKNLNYNIVADYYRKANNLINSGFKKYLSRKINDPLYCPLVK